MLNNSFLKKEKEYYDDLLASQEENFRLQLLQETLELYLHKTFSREETYMYRNIYVYFCNNPRLQE